MRGTEPYHTFKEEGVIYKVFQFDKNRVKVKAIYKNKMVVIIGNIEICTIADAKKGITNMIRKTPLG